MNGTQNIEPHVSGQIHIEQCYRLPDFEFHHADSIKRMASLKSESVKCILIDPPYKYLKNQKLEVDFDETIFFNEAKRVLKNDGFIVMFGRGTSFYRWNYMLSELGFIFKESVIWDKGMTTSPLLKLMRMHEDISIHTKKNGIIYRSKIPYLEIKRFDIQSMIPDLKRLRTTFGNAKSLIKVLDFIENNFSRTDFKKEMENKSNLRNGKCNEGDRAVTILNSIENGMLERSIIRTDRVDCDKFTKFSVNSDKRKTGDRCVNVMQSIEFGFNERSIIKQYRDHYTAIHPTQKPVRLLERLLALTTKEGDLVLDAFAGSCSTGHACLNAKRKFIGYEIDREYYEKAVERIKSVEPTLFSGCL